MVLIWQKPLAIDMMRLLLDYSPICVLEDLLPIQQDHDVEYPKALEDAAEHHPVVIDVEHEMPDHHEVPVRVPNASERRAHMLHGHIPYQSWCRTCISSKSRDAPHRRHHVDKSPLPLLCLDYCFLMSKDEGGQGVPILAGFLQPIGIGFSHVCKSKGTADGVPIASLVKWLGEFGINGELRIRTDPEPSITAVARAIGDKRGVGITFLEETAINSPASKGGVESYIAVLGGNVSCPEDECRGTLGSHREGFLSDLSLDGFDMHLGSMRDFRHILSKIVQVQS